MNIKTIEENIVDLAMEEMTEDGIHHDDFPDREFEYTDRIVRELVEDFEVEEPFDVMEELSKLTIHKK